MVAKLKFPAALDIVGIATEPGINEYSSEDALYLDAHIWTDEARRQAEKLQQDLSLLNVTKYYHVIEKEYPDMPRYGRSERQKKHKTPRNAPCPCGSGKKYKYCCMRTK